ncbi:MAG: 2-amino-4-hydroxy-6-hydroxymethyldihydropteridine diphosphokinase [Flavobacteriales bacterium]|nr:2-amino-4-hydroxy-6-hydroxymethyldihydropteridine diphosphokinase [Flavobacteriales bacterium]
MPENLVKYVLLTGADIGDRESNLANAAEMIDQKIGTVLKRSSIHETAPWGFESETRFLNQALLVESYLKPDDVLEQILAIEKKMGRIRNHAQWSSRSIDIDILVADGLVHQTETLTIPHKFLHERDFALVPLCELVPDWEHPVQKKTFGQLLEDLSNRIVKDIAI